MASAPTGHFGGISLAGLLQAKDLQRRLWFTLGGLLLFRFLSFVPLPGIDPTALNAMFEQTRGGILDFFNLFSGGGLERMSLIALGLMPYITASIVVQLAASMSPTLKALRKEGESGRKKLNQYTRYGTVFICAIQGYFIAAGLEGWGSAGASPVVNPGWMFRLTAVVSLVGGAMFLMWLGEQITSRGVGNGVSLIIMAGIVAEVPSSILQALESSRTGAVSGMAVFGVVLFAAVLVLAICFMELGQRRLPIQYPKRQGARQAGADQSHLPLKINMANVIPPIFASSLLLMPLTVVQLAGSSVEGGSVLNDILIMVTTALQHGAPLYLFLYGVGIMFFCFFYTAIVFNPEETAENLKRYGGFIPGIRPGKRTEEYLDYVLTRLTVVGSIYLTLICLLPEYLIARAGIPYYLGGTSLLIIVNVMMDTEGQVRGHLVAHQYGDLIKSARLTPRARAPSPDAVPARQPASAGTAA